MSIEILAATTIEQVERIARLAHEIWYEYYVPLIGRAQVDYMVAKFQSSTAMLGQLDEGYRYFTVERSGTDVMAAGEDGLPVGYFAVQPQPASGSLFISKLYLHRTARGLGTGRTVLEFIERMARVQALHCLSLTVNKDNPAVATYQQWGFRVAEAIVIDIGNGFVMDDFRMEKPIES